MWIWSSLPHLVASPIALPWLKSTPSQMLDSQDHRPISLYLPKTLCVVRASLSIPFQSLWKRLEWHPSFLHSHSYCLRVPSEWGRTQSYLGFLQSFIHPPPEPPHSSCIEILLRERDENPSKKRKLFVDHLKGSKGSASEKEYTKPEIKVCETQLSRNQAGPGRTVKREQ